MGHFALVHMKIIHTEAVADAFEESSHLQSSYHTLRTFQILFQLIITQTHERKH